MAISPNELRIGYKLYEFNIWNKNGGNLGNEFVLAKKISEAKNILKSNNISVNTGKTYLGKIILIREVKFLM